MTKQEKSYTQNLDSGTIWVTQKICPTAIPHRMIETEWENHFRNRQRVIFFP